MNMMRWPRSVNIRRRNRWARFWSGGTVYRIAPLILFVPRESLRRRASLPMLSGIFPEIWFDDRSITSRRDAFPIDEGIGPESMFPFKKS